MRNPKFRCSLCRHRSLQIPPGKGRAPLQMPCCGHWLCALLGSSVHPRHWRRCRTNQADSGIPLPCWSPCPFRMLAHERLLNLQAYLVSTTITVPLDCTLLRFGVHRHLRSHLILLHFQTYLVFINIAVPLDCTLLRFGVHRHRRSHLILLHFHTYHTFNRTTLFGRAGTKQGRVGT